MTRTIFLLLFVCFFGNTYSQSVTVDIRYVNKANHAKSDTIYYDVNRKLTWNDFQGKPDPNHFGGAITASGYAYDADMEFDGSSNIHLNVYVYCFFTKHDSWKKSAVNSSYHLEHEQHHFDITYLGALHFIDEVRKASFTTKNYNHLLADIFNRSYDENNAWQTKYDEQTRNSIDIQQQEAWNKKIDEKLRSATSGH